MAKFKRILLKLSGESLAGEQKQGINVERLNQYAAQIKEIAEMGVQIGIVIGGGNIFRAFPAAILNDALNTGRYDRGVIVAETFDFEVIDKAYAPYQNLSLLVSLQSTGSIEKKVIASSTVISNT